MSLVRLSEVSLAFGDRPILAGADFSIEPGERVCLIGRNGAGKSTLLGLISGKLQPDHGEIARRQGLIVSQLEQELPGDDGLTVREVVKMAFSTRIELDDWAIDQRVDSIIGELALPAERRLGELSGGWRRRVGLACALVVHPDLLLLDEPTNHLDIVTIEWLENRLQRFGGAVLFISHDRAFLDRIATRIVEVDRGRLISFPGDYLSFLEKRAQFAQDENTRNALFDKKLAQEEAWVRQGVKARRTRNEGRVRALLRLREQRTARIDAPRKAAIAIESAEQSGQKVIEACAVSHGYDGRPLINDFSVKIMRGDRIGLIGNNGVGKTTLLRILLGEMPPERGTVIIGTGLQTGYFGQLRESLDGDKTVAQIVGDDYDYVRLNGRDVHVLAYLRGFLFDAHRAVMPVSALSGGERNRVVLARLFARPSNLLVLDEPTNDLDMETLEVLEDQLAEYPGTLILVSHDRMFMDNVVTSTLAFEPGGVVRRYPGGYSDWQRQGGKLAVAEGPVEDTQPPAAATASTRSKPAKRRLSFREQQELDGLPTRIEALERTIAAIEQQVSAADFYARPWEATAPVLEELHRHQAEHDAATARWLELEELREALGSRSLS